MSFVSLTDACRQLGIDAKTLRRWLGQAQLPLLNHPSDGRKQGLSQMHLQELAKLHHRALPSPSPLPSPSAAALPADLLTLPEQVAHLQSQLSALHEQVAALRQLLVCQAQPPVQASATVPSPSPIRPASTPARKPTHVLPRLEFAGEDRYVVISPTEGVVPLQADSPAWFAWLSRQSAFRFVGKRGHFSARYDAERGSRAWRAHRKLRNHTGNLRLGRTNEVTVAVLEHAAAQFQAQLH